MGGAGWAGAGGFLRSLHCAPHQIWTQGVSSVWPRRREQGDRQVSEEQERPHWPPRGPERAEPPALGPPPEAPSSSRAASVGSAGLLSARLLCVAVGGAGAGPHEGCYEGPRQKDRWRHGRGDQGWRSRGSSQAKTLCPAGEGSPSCHPEHPEGPSPCWAGSLSGHTVGGEPPTYEQKGGAFSG